MGISSNAKVVLAGASALFASTLLITADVLTFGTPTDPNHFPIFTQTYAAQVDVEMAVWLLASSTQHLMVASLLIPLAIPLLVPGVWLVRQSFIDPDSVAATGVSCALLAAVVLTPLAHGPLLYVAEIHKAIVNTPVEAHVHLLKTAQNFTQVYLIGWGVALAVGGLGWTGYAVCMFRGRTRLARWMGLLSPACLLFVLVAVFNNAPGSVATALSGAGLSVSYLIFFLLLLIKLSPRGE